jgi:hypothetical protein
MDRKQMLVQDVYNVKRVQPGTLRGVLQFRDIHLPGRDFDFAPTGVWLQPGETSRLIPPKLNQ